MIGDFLVHALAVAISPEAIFVAVLILLTPRALSNGMALLAGWVAGMVAVSIVVLLADGLISDTPGQFQKSSVVGILRLVFGLLFLALAVRRWRRRTRRGEPKPVPRWMAALDRFGVARSFVLGAVLSSVNPKNLVLTMIAASHVAVADLNVGLAILIMAGFILLATTTIAAPLVIYRMAGDQAEARLRRLRDWLVNNNDAIIIVLLVVIGMKLFGDGLDTLLG
jgi:threonine/homoserine/homoserine lactone efflux protein